MYDFFLTMHIMKYIYTRKQIIITTYIGSFVFFFRGGGVKICNDSKYFLMKSNGNRCQGALSYCFKKLYWLHHTEIQAKCFSLFMQQKTRFNINRCTVICNLSTMKSLLNEKFKTGHGACADIEKGGVVGSHINKLKCPLFKNKFSIKQARNLHPRQTQISL